MKISLRFVSWLDILDIPACSIPYILFKLKEIKKDEVISIGLHAILLYAIGCTLIPFHFYYQIYWYLTLISKNYFACFTNIGAIGMV